MKVTILLEVGPCCRIIGSWFISYRPQDYRRSILVTTNQLCHDIQVMMKGIIPEVLAVRK